jgi:hypothetical protein
MGFIRGFCALTIAISLETSAFLPRSSGDTDVIGVDFGQRFKKVEGPDGYPQLQAEQAKSPQLLSGGSAKVMRQLTSINSAIQLPAQNVFPVIEDLEKSETIAHRNLIADASLGLEGTPTPTSLIRSCRNYEVVWRSDVNA